MIGLLLILGLLAGLVGIGSATTEVADGGPIAGPPAGSLERIDVQRTGGIAYQELEATVEDPDAVAALAELLPSPLPAVEGPSGACADCWVYRVVLDYVDANESIVLEFDQASEPPELSAFVDALDDVLE